jgi:ankyrin repeat protein
LEIVRLLVAYGANVNSEWSEYGITPFRQAIDVENTAAADYLRSAGGLEKSFGGAASDGDINLVQSWLLTSPKVVKQQKK